MPRNGTSTPSTAPAARPPGGGGGGGSGAPLSSSSSASSSSSSSSFGGGGGGIAGTSEAAGAGTDSPTSDIIRDVWADNLDDEFAKIRDLVDDYPFIAMDTEFPGIVARPIGNFTNPIEYNYHKMQCNVNLLKIIQLGVTFADANGNHPPGCCTWQFNFKFSLDEDMYAQDSIELLKSSGIDFAAHSTRGVDKERFAELLMSSGIVLNADVRWISFHSGYDFGYLLKELTSQNLPQSDRDFFELMHMYFPHVYDIKYLMEFCDDLKKGGLSQLAEDLSVQRIGPMHQAGSDALLTCKTFFKLMRMYFANNVDDRNYAGHLYGLSEPPPGVDVRVYAQF